MGIAARSSLALVAMTLAGTAHAGDFGPAPVPVETWTGFSVGVGGGVAVMDADVNSKASRTDRVGECWSRIIEPDPTDDFPPLEAFINEPCDQTGFGPTPPINLFSVDQSLTSVSNLSDTGGFFTVQGAYDYQFAPRWVAGLFVDADWSDLSARSRQTQTSSQNTGLLAQDVAFLFGVGDQQTTIDTVVSTDWSISVGGRVGWLATPRTLLYFLAAYTHQDLSDSRVRVNIADPIQSFDLALQPTRGFSNIPTDLLVKLPDSLDGFSLGGGGEVKLGGPWALKMEYRWTHLEGSSGRAASNAFQSIPTGLGACRINGTTECSALLDTRSINSQASADLDLDLHTVRAVLTYHFWSGGHGG